MGKQDCNCLGRGDGQIRGTRTEQWSQVRVAGGDVCDARSDLADLNVLLQKKTCCQPSHSQHQRLRDEFGHLYL